MPDSWPLGRTKSTFDAGQIGLMLVKARRRD
jgi:hypothetical protein